MPQQERIKLSQVSLTDWQILIMSESSCTVWIDERPVDPYLNPEGLLFIYAQVLRKAKDKGIKVSYGLRLKSKLQNLEELIPECLKKAQALYQALKEGWIAKVEGGIYPGYADDAEIDRLSKLKWEYQKLFHLNQPLGQLLNIKSILSDHMDNVKREDITKICL